MPEWPDHSQLEWASRNLNEDEYAGARKHFPGQKLPKGEYIDGQTGAFVVIWQDGQTVPDGTVYISEQGLQDAGIMA